MAHDSGKRGETLMVTTAQGGLQCITVEGVDYGPSELQQAQTHLLIRIYGMLEKLSAPRGEGK